MNAFHSGQEAKEFLICQIVAEAQRENYPALGSRAQNAVLHRNWVDGSRHHEGL